MLTKYATFDVLEARMARKGSGLVRDAHKHHFAYDPQPGYLYVRSRAISSRTNDNYDNFPAEEIKKGYRTFIGKPVFVNHHNDNHRRARGVIVDAALHEDTNPDGSPDTWAEVLMQVDAINFPKLAQAILAGEIDRTSMGTDVAYSVCSICGNKAETPHTYCAHIPKSKGMKVRRTTASGAKEDVLCYEKCYGLSFFENSLLVEEPADPTAAVLGVDSRGFTSTATNTFQFIGGQGQGASITYPSGSVGGVGGGSVTLNVSPNLRTASHAAAKMISSYAVGDQCYLCGEIGISGENGNGNYLCPNCGSEWDSHGVPREASLRSRRTASRRTALDEVKAPAEVDTLRDESCPVCSESDNYDGQTCRVCNFVRPPDEFMDPDLSKAKQVDLRQDQNAEVGGNPWEQKTRPADPAGEQVAAQNPWELKTKPANPANPELAGPQDLENPEAEPWKLRTRKKAA